MQDSYDDAALGDTLPVLDDMPPPLAGTGSVALAASLILVAFNLRPVFSSLSTLLPEVMAATGLGPGGASLLTTLPVLCLGVFSFGAPDLARRFGSERVILACCLLLAAGTALRGIPAVPALFLGAALAGASIAVVNVLLPSVVKRDFPRRSAVMTGLYTMALCGGAAVAAAITVPIEHGFGGSWPAALAIWAVPALVAAVVFAPQALREGAGRAAVRHRVTGLARDGLAWQVTFFMGLQSAMAYIVFGWLAPMLRERGLDPVTAGLVVSVSVMAQMVACLAVPSIAVRQRDQRGINVLLTGLAVAGFLALSFAPLRGLWLYATVLGLGQGGLIAAAMTLIILRSPDVHVAARLSGMAQGTGYTLAAAGPLLAGALRGWTGGFAAAAALFALLGVAAAWNGWGAGRARHVTARSFTESA
jgi:CP family cyanate transporter-like MFS transporter